MSSSSSIFDRNPLIFSTFSDKEIKSGVSSRFGKMSLIFDISSASFKVIASRFFAVILSMINSLPFISASGSVLLFPIIYSSCPTFLIGEFV